MLHHDVKKMWRKYVANTGSIPTSRCYENYTQKICQALATAFAPSEDAALTFGNKFENYQKFQHQPATDNQEADRRFTDPQQANGSLAIQPQSNNNIPATVEQITPGQTTEDEDIKMAGTEMLGDNRVATAERVTETQDVEMRGIDEQRASASDQSVEATVSITEAVHDTKDLVDPLTIAAPPEQTVPASNNPFLAPAARAVRPPFYSMPLNPAHTELRALYLNLLYHDRFTLLSNPKYLLFLSEQPHLSHSFLRYLISHRFGMRYVHRDRGNANHGLVPFQFPFQPVRRDLPLRCYVDNRWALLNDPAWLEWVSREEFIMAAFWAEMSYRGGLGVLQRRKGVAERESIFAVAPF